LDSAKALNRLTGHEITHSLEKAKNYNELRDHLFAYAKAKGVDIDSELAILKSKYQGIANANPEAELVADLVGDYLFTDADFINSLSTEKPNVFKRIYNEIKYLCKIATAGSKEARELEKVKRAFDKAYKESANTKTTDTKYSVSENIGKVERYADEGIGESIFRTNWLQYNQQMVDEIVKNRAKTETDNFKSWFNESKAKNQNVEPLLVFHGTNSRFTQFKNDSGALWFSGNPMYAKVYSSPSKLTDKLSPSGKIYGGSNDRVIPAYIRA
jgi:rRNA-processing protein FCF1